MFCHASEKYEVQLLISLHNEMVEHVNEYLFWKCKLGAPCFGLTVGMQTQGDTGTVPSAQHLLECTWKIGSSFSFQLEREIDKIVTASAEGQHSGAGAGALAL